MNSIRNPECTKCELYKTCETICLINGGNEHAEIMLVGEAPGETEDIRGIPFVGDAGRLLNNILAEYGLSRDATSGVYVTNAVKCRPPNNSTPKLRNVDACRPYLLEEIRQVKPKLIIGLGNIAMQSLMNIAKFKIGNMRGGVYHLPEDDLSNIPIIPTYHPAYLKRNENAIPYVLEDFERAIKTYKSGYKAARKALYYSGISEYESEIVLDLETTGLDPWAEETEILCVGSTSQVRVGYCTEFKQSYDDIKNICEANHITKIGHNFKFDIKWLRSKGIKVKGPIFDTMIAAHLLDENKPSYGLKELLLLHSDMGNYSDKVEKVRKLVGNSRDIPKNVLQVYCAKDVDGTYRLYEKYKKELEEQNLMPLFELVMQGEKVMAEAEYQGVQIDTDVCKRLGNEFKERIMLLQDQVDELVDEPNFNPGSVQQLAEVLHGKFGLPIVKYTKKNQVSVDSEALRKLAEYDKTNLCKGILRIRELKGDYAKYLNPKDPPFKSDNRIHADFRLNGAKTTRWSCTDPNLMAITKKSPIKKMFISRWKGGKIGQVDYDQGELRILAQESGDKVLTQYFNSGVDIHKATAAETMSISIENVTDKQRFTAKAVNFGIIYGIGPKKLAHTIDSSEEEAADYIKKYLKRLKQVREYIEERHRQIRETGEVRGYLFGNTRRITLVNLDDWASVSRAERQAVNAPIQGGLHQLNILSIVESIRRMHKAKMKTQFMMPVHDSGVYDIYPGEEEEWVKIIRDVFQNPDTSNFGFKFTVPLTVSIGIGNNWKELESVA